MYKKLAVIITVILLSSNTYAQFGNMITNKLLEKSQQKKSTTTPTTTKEVEQKEVKESESSDQEDEKAYQNMMGGSSSKKEKIQAEYIFQSNVVMQIEAVDKAGKSEGKSEMVLHINKDGNYSGSEMKSKDSQGGISIFDWTNRIMISLMNQEGKKIGMAMDLKDNSKESKSKADVPMKFTKTGKTKSITGYLCEEYIAENEETNIDMWLTQALDFNLSKSMEYFSQQNNSSNYAKDAPKGFMMETTTTDKKKGNKSIMVVTQVNKFANKTFKTSEYTFY